MKSVNFQTRPSTLTANLTPLTTPSKPNMVFLFHIRKNPCNKTSSHLLPHCSTKPNTEIGSISSSANEDEGLVGNESALGSSNDCNDLSASSNKAVSSSSSQSSTGLVFDLGIQGSWDSYEVGSPVVKRFLSDDQERWYMWYHGRSYSNSEDGDSIGIAVSSNGVHWKRGQSPLGSSTGLGRVMGHGDDWWAFDTKGARPSEVMIMSSSKLRPSNAVYWLYYTGFSSEETEFGTSLPRISRRSLPGLAISQDGRHWAKVEGEHHTGALLSLGSEGEWDSLSISSPHVIIHSKNDMRMYYHSFDPNTSRFTVGVARSRDGLKWVKLGPINVGGSMTMTMKNPCVVRDKDDGRYLMAYEGEGSGGGGCIGLAVSSDGLKEWRPLMEEPVLEVGSGWDSGGVSYPCLVQMEGNGDEKWRLYYRGIGDGGKTGIGMAVCDAGTAETSIKFRKWPHGIHL